MDEQIRRRQERHCATVTAILEVSDGRQGDTAGDQVVVRNVAEDMKYDEPAITLSRYT